MVQDHTGFLVLIGLTIACMFLWDAGKDIRRSAFLRMVSRRQQFIYDIPEALGATGTMGLLIVGYLNMAWWFYKHDHPILLCVQLAWGVLAGAFYTLCKRKEGNEPDK